MYLLYDNTNGMIKAHGIRLLTSAQGAVDNNSVLALYSYDDLIVENYYFPGGTLTARPKFNLTIGATTIAERELTQITGIPANTRVHVLTHIDEIINDGELLISFDYANVYRLRLSNFPYKQKVITYHVY